jgi:glycosyltransferase involved in cell wall biosynthesis
MSKVSVIVSVYSKDRLQCVLDCIDSLRRQSEKPFEIIVVLDPNPDLIGFYRSRLNCDVRIVVSDGFGLSNARNVGVKNAKGDIVAFIDDDAVADKEWLKNLLKGYNDSSVVGVGGYIKPLWERGRPKWFPEELDWIVGCSYKGLPEYTTFVRNPIGCNMSLRKEIFEVVGYFRSDVGRYGKKLLSGEEPEFSIRIFRRLPNAKILYTPSAIVYHKVTGDRLSLSYLFIRSFNEGVSKAIISGFSSSASVLSTESIYLHYLFRVALPLRLKRSYSFEYFSQLLVLLFSMGGVFMGFVFQKFLR